MAGSLEARCLSEYGVEPATDGHVDLTVLQLRSRGGRFRLTLVRLAPKRQRGRVHCHWYTICQRVKCVALAYGTVVR